MPLVSLAFIAGGDATSCAATGEGVDDDAPLARVVAGAVAAAGVERLSRYATKALKSVPVALTGGMPPAFILSVGCCRTVINAEAVIVGPSFVKAGPLLVPIPPAPWQAAQPSVVKMVSPRRLGGLVAAGVALG